MKRTILSALVGLVALSFGAAVFAAGIEEGKLTIWVNGDKGYDGIAKVGALYEKKTGIKVTVAHPDNVVENFHKTAASGNGPDIVMWAHDRYGEWVKADLLAEIEPTEEDFNKFEKVAWDAMRVNGKYYGYPVSIEAISMICNKDIFPQVPKTFEEFADLDTELQKQGKHALLWDYDDVYFTYPILSANGGYAYKADENVKYDVTSTGVANEGAKIGLSYLVDMVKNNHIPNGTDRNKMDTDFSNGKVGCIINGAWGWSSYSKINYSVNTFPTLNGKQAKPFVGVLGMVINRSSPNQEQAKDFLLNYLLTDSGLEEVNNDKPLGAVALKSYEEKLEKDPRIAATMANAKNGDLMPNVPEMNKFWSSVQTALKSATNGKQSVEDALNTAESRMVGKKRK